MRRISFPGGGGGLSVYLRDRLIRTTELVSVNLSGTFGERHERLLFGLFGPADTSPFGERRPDIVNGDTNWSWDIFVRDRQSGTTDRVSVSSAGAQGDLDSWPSLYFGRRRFVAFESVATLSSARTRNGASDIFVHDSRAERPSESAWTLPEWRGTNQSYNPSISADGRFVAFDSIAEKPRTWGTLDGQVFVRDRLSGTTELVSVALGRRVSRDRKRHAARCLLPSAQGDAHQLGRAAQAIPDEDLPIERAPRYEVRRDAVERYEATVGRNGRVVALVVPLHSGRVHADSLGRSALEVVNEDVTGPVRVRADESGRHALERHEAAVGRNRGKPAVKVSLRAGGADADAVGRFRFGDRVRRCPRTSSCHHSRCRGDALEATYLPVEETEQKSLVPLAKVPLKLTLTSSVVRISRSRR